MRRPVIDHLDRNRIVLPVGQERRVRRRVRAVRVQASLLFPVGSPENDAIVARSAVRVCRSRAVRVPVPRRISVAIAIGAVVKVPVRGCWIALRVRDVAHHGDSLADLPDGTDGLRGRPGRRGELYDVHARRRIERNVELRGRVVGDVVTQAVVDPHADRDVDVARALVQGNWLGGYRCATLRSRRAARGPGWLTVRVPSPHAQVSVTGATSGWPIETFS